MCTTVQFHSALYCLLILTPPRFYIRLVLITLCFLFCLPTRTLCCQFLLHYMLALSRWQRSHVTVVACMGASPGQLPYHPLSPSPSTHNRYCSVVLINALLQATVVDVPSGRFAQRQWWEVFSPGTSEQTLQDIACKIMSVSDKSHNSGSNYSFFCIQLSQSIERWGKRSSETSSETLQQLISCQLWYYRRVSSITFRP